MLSGGRTDLSKRVGARSGHAFSFAFIKKAKQLVRERMRRTAQRDGVLAARDEVLGSLAFLEHNRERTGPKGVRKLFNVARNILCPVGDRVRAADMNDQRVRRRTIFSGVYAFNRRFVLRIRR